MRCVIDINLSVFTIHSKRIALGKSYSSSTLSTCPPPRVVVPMLRRLCRPVLAPTFLGSACVGVFVFVFCVCYGRTQLLVFSCVCDAYVVISHHVMTHRFGQIVVMTAKKQSHGEPATHTHTPHARRCWSRSPTKYFVETCFVFLAPVLLFGAVVMRFSVSSVVAVDSLPPQN